MTATHAGVPCYMYMATVLGSLGEFLLLRTGGKVVNTYTSGIRELHAERHTCVTVY